MLTTALTGDKRRVMIHEKIHIPAGRVLLSIRHFVFGVVLNFFLLSVISSAQAQLPKQTPKSQSSPNARPLAQRIASILQSPGAREAHWGIQVISLPRGEEVFGLNPEKLFVPASTAKLFITAAALTRLGPDFTYRTTLEATGPVDKNGTVHGDLVLVGRGDPNLSARALPYEGRTERNGDPAKALEELIDQILARGVHSVDGDLIVDDTYFVFQPFGQGWAVGDLVWGYGAPVSALSINDNVVTLRILPGSHAGDLAVIRQQPLEGYFDIVNHVVTVPGGPEKSGSVTPLGSTRAGSNRTSVNLPRLAESQNAENDQNVPSAERPQIFTPAHQNAPPPQQARRLLGTPGKRRLSVDRLPGSHTLLFWGQIATGEGSWVESVAMDDPARVAGEWLLQELTRRGVKLTGTFRMRRLEPFDVPDLRGAPVEEREQGTGNREQNESLNPLVPRGKLPGGFELAFHQSLPLADSLKVITKVSQNLHAEMLLRTLGREERNVGSVEAGLEVVNQFLREIGVPEDGVQLRDGSGLSRESLVSPSATTALLRSMYGSRYRSVWVDLLPVAGQDGSLTDRLRDHAVAGRVHAKTGNLAGVASLAGYLIGANTEPLAFAIFVNHHNLTSAAANRLIDRIVEELAKGR